MKRLFKILLPALFGLLVYATVRLLQDTGSGFRFWERSWVLNALELLLSGATGYAALAMVNGVCRYTDRRLEKTGTAALGREVLRVLALNALLINVILTPWAALTDDGMSWNDLATLNTVPQLYVLIYYGVIRSRTYLGRYVQQQVLVQRLTNDQLQTELRFLRAQYHPHFLFNALNTIYFQMDDDVPGAKRSLETLSELLRYQLYDQQQRVTVGQEVEYLQNYIALQKTRASEKLRLTVDFDAAVLNQPVYPLLFLPLVENAFKYVGGNYTLEIKGCSAANGLRFTVKNDLPAHALPPGTASGIGLENLTRRLQLLYPNQHTLTTGRQGNAFVAELEINTL